MTGGLNSKHLFLLKVSTTSHLPNKYSTVQNELTFSLAYNH